MAAEADHNTWQPLEYQPLHGSDIRLVQIGKAQPDGILHCTMHHAPLSADLDFNALSYVWGDSNDTVSIVVNGQSLEVTRNLYGFLKQISESDDMCRCERPSAHFDVLKKITQQRKSGLLYWWIDAICINQNCLEEKNSQVPRMGTLYSSASEVWIWFGRAEAIFADTNSIFHHTRILLSARWISDIVEYSETWNVRLKATHMSILSRLVVNHYGIQRRRAGRGLRREMRSRRLHFSDLEVQEAIGLFKSINTSWSKTRRTNELAEMLMCSDELQPPSIYMQALIRELCYLLKNPWFTRIWTFQEYALSTGRVKAMIGDYTFWASVLFSYVCKAVQWTKDDHGQTMGERYLILKNYWLMDQLSQTQQNYGNTWTSGSSSKTPEQACTELLVCSAERESKIPHDRIYGTLGLLPARLPEFLDPDYSLPYELVCWKYIQHLVSVTKDLRIIETRKEMLDRVPSWVHSLLDLPRDIYFRDRRAVASVSFSGDDKQLTVRGLYIGQMLDCTCLPYQAEDWVDYANRLQHVILPRSASILGLSYEQKLADFVRRIPLWARSSRASVVEIVNAALALDKDISLLRLLSDCSREQDFDRISYALLSTGFTGACAHRYGVGSIPEHKEEVWVLKGCSMPSILRPVDGGYLYVGRVSIEDEEWYRVGDISDAAHDMEEGYFANSNLQDVTLV